MDPGLVVSVQPEPLIFGTALLGSVMLMFLPVGNVLCHVNLVMMDEGSRFLLFAGKDSCISCGDEQNSSSVAVMRALKMY